MEQAGSRAPYDVLYAPPRLLASLRRIQAAALPGTIIMEATSASTEDPNEQRLG